MKKVITSLCIIITMLSACKKDPADNPGLQSLDGKSYVLNIDRALGDVNPQLPYDSFPDSDYLFIDESIHYDVTFSGDGQSVMIDQGAIVGSLIDKFQDSRTYDLDEGLFAGGVLRVWENKGVFEAEFRIFGSGLPIVFCVRGCLELKN